MFFFNKISTYYLVSISTQSDSPTACNTISLSSAISRDLFATLKSHKRILLPNLQGIWRAEQSTFNKTLSVDISPVNLNTPVHLIDTRIMHINASVMRLTLQWDYRLTCIWIVSILIISTRFLTNFLHLFWLDTFRFQFQIAVKALLFHWTHGLPLSMTDVQWDG